ncbi:MAG: hypothetical protein ABI142_05870, partial [Bryocella sp.]
MEVDVIVLPDLLEDVTVPEYFNPTAVATNGGCRLRMILASTRVDFSKLPAGPNASIGTLIHRVIETWERGASGFADASDLFDSEYERIRTELSHSVYTARFCDLKSTRTASDWSWTRQQAISRCLLDRRGSSAIG